MGFFSFITVEGKSISNRHSWYGAFTVYMIDDLGNKWREDNYDGYGDFGGKSYIDLAEEMTERLGRTASPIFSENPDTVWCDQEVKMCEYQGFFYDPDVEDPEFAGYEDDPEMYGDETDPEFSGDDDPDFSGDEE